MTLQSCNQPHESDQQPGSQRTMSSGGPGQHEVVGASAGAGAASSDAELNAGSGVGKVVGHVSGGARALSLAYKPDLTVHASAVTSTPRRPWGHRRMHSCPTVPHQFGALSLVSLTPTAVSRSPSLKQHHQRHRRLPSAHLPATGGLHAAGASPPGVRRSSLPNRDEDEIEDEEEDDGDDREEASTGPASGAGGTQCGWLCYQPDCLQPLARPVPFAVAVIGLYFVQSFIVSGYINSINTTIELRYGLSTREIGYIYASYEVACIVATFFISYFGHGRNRAQLLGAGCLIIALGYLLFAFPHFLGSSISNNVRNLTDTGPDGLCLNSLSPPLPLPSVELRPDCKVQNSALLILCISFALVGLGASPVYILAPTYLWDNVPQYSYPVYAASLHITSALGPACGFLGGAVFLSMYVNFPLEPPENLHSSHPLWAGAWWMGFLVFAGLAVLVAIPLMAFPSALPQRSVQRRRDQPGDVVKVEMRRPDDGDSPATAMTATATPTDLEMEAIEVSQPGNVRGIRSVEIVMLNPASKQDRTASLSTNASTGSSSSAGGRSGNGGNGGSQPHIRDIPAGLARLFNNPLWLFISLLIVAEQSVVQAFVAYVNKYMQKSFGLPVTRSSIVTGLLVIPSAVIGIGAGAFFMRRFRPSSRAISVTMMSLSVCTTLLTTGLVLCTCGNIQLAGLTVNYHPTDFVRVRLSSGSSAAAAAAASSSLDPVPLQLNASCNAKCACSTFNYDPVCDQATGISYYSPCHAGCANRTLRHPPSSSSKFKSAAATAFAVGHHSAFHWNYTDCACVPRSAGHNVSRIVSGSGGGGGIVSSGKCGSTCTTFVPFCILLFIIVLVTACGYEPCHILTLSCVSETDSSFALGMQNVLHRLLAFIPAPIYFGSLFDSTCLLRASDGSACDKAGRACTEYDLSRLPYLWIGVILALKLLGFLFASACYFSCRISEARTAEVPDVAAAADAAAGPDLSIVAADSSSVRLSKSRVI